MIAGVLQRAFAYQAESLARSAAEHNVDIGISYLRMRPDVFAIDIRHASADRCTVGKIEFMRCGVDRIVLHCRQNREPSLSKTEGHPSRACKEIDADQSPGTPHNGIFVF